MHVTPTEEQWKLLTEADSTVPVVMQDWISINQVACDHFQRLMAELKASTGVDFAMLSVAISETQNLLRTVKLEQPNN